MLHPHRKEFNGDMIRKESIASPDYTSSWRAYKRRVFVMDLFKIFYSCLGISLIFVGAFVFLGIYLVVTALGIQSLEAQLSFALALFAIILFLPPVYFFSFRCPRCHQKFFVSNTGREPDRKTCCHCGLSIHGNPKEDEIPSTI